MQISIPHAEVSVAPSLPELDLHAKVKALATGLLTGWSSLEASNIQVSTISGGITNLLLKLTPPNGTGLGAVAMRLFGDNTDLLIDREAEARNLRSLNAAGFGAEVLGTFANGRFESFLNMRPLQPEEMLEPDMQVRIARRLRKFHAIDVAVQKPSDRSPQEFATIFRWLEMARDVHLDDPVQQAELDKHDLDAMEAELREVQAACKSIASPLVFCHNDLLSGNIMVPLELGEPTPPTNLKKLGSQEMRARSASHDLGDITIPTAQNASKGTSHAAAANGTGRHERQASGEAASTSAKTGSVPSSGSIAAIDEAGAADMQFIDFEYGAFGHRGFDWGNHFNEYAGFECDYSRYPTPSAAAHFLRAYLRGPAGEEPSQREVEAAVVEADLFSLVSHQFWGTWAILQAKYSPIEFDYVGYSFLRWGEYRGRKAGVMQQLRELRGVSEEAAVQSGL